MLERIRAYYLAKKPGKTPDRVMVCTLETLHIPATPDGVTWTAFNADSPFEVAHQGYVTNAIGFGESPEVNEADVQVFHASLTDHYGFTMFLNGNPVAAGMYNDILDGVTELLGITTLPAYRQRGSGAWLTAKITEHAFAHGVDLAFLVPVDANSRRVYERVGYQLINGGL